MHISARHLLAPGSDESSRYYLNIISPARRIETISSCLLNVNEAEIDSRVHIEKENNNMEKKIDFNGDFSNEYDDIVHMIIPAYHSISSKRL